MEVADYILESWTTNQLYNAIYNCKAVKPPYEEEWFYNNEFYLDKREGLTYSNQMTGKTVYDRIKLNGNDIYLYKESDAFFWIKTATNDTLYTFNDTLPKRIYAGNGVTGARKSTNTVVSRTAEVGTPNFVEIPGYNWGYVTVTLNSIWSTVVGDFVIFTTGILKWAVNKVYQIVGNTIYIIGTNQRASLPAVGDTLSVYSHTGQLLLTCTEQGVTATIYNGTNPVEWFTLISLPWIIDIAKYDGNFFALTENFMYFTRATFDDNIQFYPLDFYKIDKGYKLFPCGKVMIVFGQTNKLFAAASGTGWAIWYVWYDVNYNAQLFSTHSCIFIDQSIFVMQSDKKLMQLDIIQTNTTSYDIVAKDMNENTRWIFERVTDWVVEMKWYNKFFYVIHRTSAGKTTIYEFDKQLKHWLLQTYWFHIYWYDYECYGVNGIYNRTGDTDVWVDINQSVNYSLVGNTEILMPVVMRFMLWLHDEKNDFKIKITFDLWWIREELLFDIDDIKPDSYFDPPVDVWVGIESALPNEFTGTIYSVQKSIYKSGRFINFSYYGTKRFIVGRTMIIYDKMQLFINEF